MSCVLLSPLVTETNWVSWHSINVIRPALQEIVLKYVKKGTRVLVNGRLEYQTKFNDDGTRIRNSNVIAGEICVCVCVVQPAALEVYTETACVEMC